MRSHGITIRSASEGDAKSTKSWIKFDINDLNVDLSRLKSATLSVSLYSLKTGTCSWSAVNDDYTTNIDWTHSNLTWNTASRKLHQYGRY